MTHALLVTQDLMLGSQVRGAVAGLDMVLRQVGPPTDDSPTAEAWATAEFVLWDLELGVPPAHLVQNGTARWIAFGPHVDEATLQAARDAGCQAVMPRGKFLANIPQVLASRE